MIGIADPENPIGAAIDCNKYDVELFKRSFEDDNNFVVIHQNIRSFNRNGDELLLFLVNLGVDVDVLIVVAYLWII